MKRTTGFAVAFAQIAAAAVACGGLADGAATSSTSSSSGGSSSGGNTCAPMPILDGLAPTAPFDWVALRTELLEQTLQPSDAGAGDGGDGGGSLVPVTTRHDVSTLEEHGQRCKNATNASACASALDGLRVVEEPVAGSGRDCVPRQFTPPGCSALYVSYTRGDTVKALTTAADLVRELGAIDTPDEAWLVARFGHAAPTCNPKYPEYTPTATATGDGYELVFLETSTCAPLFGVKLRVHADGRVEEVSKARLEEATCAIGRRPDGLEDGDPRDARDRPETAAELFARAARLEEASVTAFRVLARELREHGAPPELSRRALRSARDEIRHTRSTSRVARALGAEPRRAAIAPRSARSLLAVARENAVEGCVRETYGALLAAYQARAARDSRVRDELATIAADEARHAELSWDVHRWIMGRLSEDERATIRLAMSAAIAELGRELAIEPSDDVVETAGMPTRAVALTLFAALGAHVRPLAA